MLTQKEFRQGLGTMCPYGRNARIGDECCRNCKFHRIEKEHCTGDEISVQRHMALMKRFFRE